MTNKEAKAKTIGASSEDELRHAIGLQMIKLGINGKDIPDQAKVITMQWIRKHWGWVSIFQFSNAFNLAINGKLDVDAACYGKFTIEYVGRILAAWLVYAKQTGTFEKEFDKQRRFTDHSFDRDKITPMGSEVAEWIKELEAKAKIKKYGKEA